MPKFHVQTGCDTPGFEGVAITCVDHNGNPIARVQEFDSDTGLAIVKVADWVIHCTQEQLGEMLSKIPAEYHDRIRTIYQVVPSGR